MHWVSSDGNSSLFFMHPTGSLIPAVAIAPSNSTRKLCVQVCVCVCVCVCVLCVHMLACVCGIKCVCICTYVCAHVCIYAFPKQTTLMQQLPLMCVVHDLLLLPVSLAGGLHRCGVLSRCTVRCQYDHIWRYHCRVVLEDTHFEAER